MKVMSVKHQMSLSKQKTPHDTSCFSGTVGAWETTVLVIQNQRNWWVWIIL